MPASTILLLESDPPTDDTIVEILTGASYGVTRTVQPDDVLTGVPDHQLLILDAGRGPRSAIEICRQVRSTPALANIPVLCISGRDDVEERISFLEAGADDVMARPFDARELEARVEALLLRFRRSKDLAPSLASGGLAVGRSQRSAVVFSPKGGAGTTTIATNMAVAAASRRPDRVVLIDLALQFGGIATHLNLHPRQTLADLIRDESAIQEPELLRGYAVRHASGLHVLAAPPAPEAAETITAAHVALILTTALAAYDLLVVDAGSTLDDRVLIVFEAADTVIVPVYAEISALKAVHSLLEYLKETGSVAAKSTLVLNSPFAREILKLRDVESALGGKVAFELPYDAFLYLKAVNEGVPIVVGAAHSAAAERLVELSESVFGDTGLVAAQVAPEPRKSGGLFRRRR